MPEHQEWCKELAAVPWVRTRGGATVALSKAFAPSADLAQWKLRVVNSNAAQLGTDDAATLRAGVFWGLKADLDWSDCVAEAHAGQEGVPVRLQGLFAPETF